MVLLKLMYVYYSRSRCTTNLIGCNHLRMAININESTLYKQLLKRSIPSNCLSDPWWRRVRPSRGDSTVPYFDCWLYSR
ncbi:hypothetical protein GGP41_001007 [Bipolaris sorokiniana]|uniref:Uncharacterized protein n=1 Tax=Cochliobolus sativus TaxID=45130 RepID=A0A8H5ZQB6_COCSA|nr:hypothetical protein GGP41_001007 [Bipolaris sorokiniana]